MKKETWKPIPNFEGIYLCSNFGRIKSLKRKGKRHDYILGERKDDKGYLHVNLCKGGEMFPFRVHRIVALLFVKNPSNKPHVNHKDGNPSNAHYSNLEWCTHSENHKHAYLMGLKVMPKTKLNHKQVLEIYNSKECALVLSTKYGICERSIYQIKIGQTWQHITGGKYKAKKRV